MTADKEWNLKKRSHCNWNSISKSLPIVGMVVSILAGQFLPIEFSPESIPDEKFPITTSETWTFVETTNVVKSGSDPVSVTDSITAIKGLINSESGLIIQ